MGDGKTVAVAAIMTAAVIASAGAAATVLAPALMMYTGMTFTTATAVVTIGGYVTGSTIAAFGASDVGEIWSGHNVIRDDIMGGNQELYDTTKTFTYMAGVGYVQAGSMAPRTNRDSSATNQSGSSSKIDVLSNKSLTNQTGKVYNYSSPIKGNEAAMNDFDVLNPSNVRTYPNGTVVGDLPNNCTINVHPSTSLGGTPTLEIYDTLTGISTKIRY